MSSLLPLLPTETWVYIMELVTNELKRKIKCLEKPTLDGYIPCKTCQIDLHINCAACNASLCVGADNDEPCYCICESCDHKNIRTFHFCFDCTKECCICKTNLCSKCSTDCDECHGNVCFGCTTGCTICYKTVCDKCLQDEYYDEDDDLLIICKSCI